MKKLIFILFIFLFLLSGCTGQNMFLSESTEYTVSAIGFNKTENGIKAMFEAVIINTDDSEKDIKRAVITGSGKTVMQAVKNAKEKTAQPLMLSHTALIILGEDINKSDFNDIYGFCLNDEEISVAIGFVCTDDAERLLNCKPVSSITVGYDIADMLKTQHFVSKLNFKNRFYQSYTQKDIGYWTLPVIKVKGGDFRISGTKNQTV